MFNNNIYYALPIEDLTDQMIEDSLLTSRETIRESVRPIDGKIYTIFKFDGDKPLPQYMNSFKKHQFTHEQALNYIDSAEWNLGKPIEELRESYDFKKIKIAFEQEYYIQCLGEMYIFIFKILKFKFFIHHKQYLNSPEKWKIFKNNRFEKAKETALIELCVFYDLLTSEEKVLIEKFKDIRNNFSHGFDHKFGKKEIEESLAEIDNIISKNLDTIIF